MSLIRETRNSAHLRHALRSPKHSGKGIMKVGENFCPGILHAVPAKDGMLIRIRVPGGLIESRQLSAVAALSAAFADGQVEITSRSNLQLRAIKECSLSEIVDALMSVELLPSRQHDRVRNIFTSALAGLDSEELIDTRSLVRELDKRLIADDAFVDLHPKFSFGIYGNSLLFCREQDDLALRAVSGSESTWPALFQLFLGGTDTGYAVSLDHAVDCLLQAARSCILLARQHGLPVRAKSLLAASGIMESILQTLSPLLTPSLNQGFPSSVRLSPPGVYEAAQQGQRNIIPAIPLGRLTSQQAQRLSESAAESEGDLRLAPWRGVVLGAIPLDRTAAVAAQLDSVGLYLDGRSGFQGIAACAGLSGCEASLADVRTDAATLARHLAERAVLPGWTVNFSGCEKQCAMRQGATAELIGTPAGYLLRIDGRSIPAPCSPQSAISLILAAHKNFSSEVAPS
jgi:precorrin-3B synthase